MLGGRRSRRRIGLLSPSAALRRRRFYLLFGDGRFWRDVMYVMYARRAVKHVLGRRAEWVALEKLRPGQSVHVTALPTRRRKDRDPR